MIRGGATALCWLGLVLELFAVVVFDVSFVVVEVVAVGVSDELGSVVAVVVVAVESVESLRTLRGREGILAGGDVIGGGGIVVNSVVVVVGSLTGCGRGWD